MHNDKGKRIFFLKSIPYLTLKKLILDMFYKSITKNIIVLKMVITVNIPLGI